MAPYGRAQNGDAVLAFRVKDDFLGRYEVRNSLTLFKPPNKLDFRPSNFDYRRPPRGDARARAHFAIGLS